MAELDGRQLGGAVGGLAAGEELHGMIARRYGAPMASLRDSLYDLMFNDEAAQQLLGATRSALMAGPSNIHPTAAGFKVFGDVVAFTVRQTLAAVLANGAADPAAIASAEKYAAGSDLPLPISPVAGVVGILYQPNTKNQSRATFMKGHGQELQALGATLPAQRMAIAHVKCVRGCRCQPVQLTFHLEVDNGIAVTKVSLHPNCVVCIDIQTDPATGGDEFAVTGIAVVAFSEAAPVHPVDFFDIAAGRAKGQQLPISWP
ncbi:hypothetical protein COO60DRAFT_1465698 [Scenedesmus sp. NREL 46B-D3]|nr:hypothetical protein COO60DRAFT_1465698 [Scenedesmus sp. NREL 46B-D3]